MSDDISVTGADDFYRLSKALKHAGRGDLRKELNKGLRTASKPLIKKAKARAKSDLPQRGGLAQRVAREPMRAQVRTGEKTAGVRITVGRKRGGARATNRGFIRHPVFGNRDIWVDQQVPSGWFDETMRGGVSEIRPQLERAMSRVVEQVISDARKGV